MIFDSVMPLGGIGRLGAVGGVLFCIFMLHFLAEPVRWFVYGQVTFRASFKKILAVFSVTALGSYLLPFKLGVPLRLWLLAKYVERNTNELGAVLIFDALLYYFIWAIVCGVIVTFGGIQTVWHGWDFNYNRWLVAVGVVGLCCLLCLGYNKGHRFYGRVVQLKERFRLLLNMRTIALAGGVVVADVFSHGLRHFVILQALGDTVAWCTVFKFSILAVGVGIFSMLPMGLLGYDLAITVLLTSEGVPALDVVSVIAIVRSMNMICAGVLGGWGANSLNISWRAIIANGRRKFDEK